MHVAPQIVVHCCSLLMFLNVFHTIYNSFQMSCKGKHFLYLNIRLLSRVPFIDSVEEGLPVNDSVNITISTVVDERAMSWPRRRRLPQLHNY